MTATTIRTILRRIIAAFKAALLLPGIVSDELAKLPGAYKAQVRRIEAAKEGQRAAEPDA